MKITIDDSICKRNNVTIEELLVLITSYYKINIKETIQNLIDKNLGYKNPFDDSNIILSNINREFIEDIVLFSDKNIREKDKLFTDIASKIREIYPAGKSQELIICGELQKQKLLKDLLLYVKNLILHLLSMKLLMLLKDM